MPVYLYRIVTPDDSGEVFEVEQAANSPLLKKHPVTGAPVERVYEAPNLSTEYVEGKTKRILSKESVEKQGFARYERDKGTGAFHRTAGKTGPEEIRPGE